LEVFAHPVYLLFPFALTLSTADKITKTRFSVHTFLEKEVKAWHLQRIKKKFQYSSHRRIPSEQHFKELKNEFREYP